MKKSLLSILAMSLMMVSCAEAKNQNATEATTPETEVTEVNGVECVASGDVVFIDYDYILTSSKFNAECVALETKMNEFRDKSVKAQEGWQKKEQGLAYEYNKLQSDAAKLEEEYAKGLITTLNAQKKQEEMQTKAASIQNRMNNYQSTVQKETAELAKEEQNLNEEYMVIMNRFQDLVNKAVKELNADRRYKMIVNKVAVVDANPELNISDLVLERVDALYEAASAEE